MAARSVRPPLHPWWVWPACALVAVLVASLTLGFDGNIFVAEGVAVVVTLALGLSARRWWPRERGTAG